MKLKMYYVLTVLFLFLSSATGLAAENYVKDNAGVLNSSTVTQVNANLTKLENNTKTQAKIVIIKSLEGKNIDEYTSSVAKTLKTDKYAIFVVSVGDHKNKFLVGKGLNNVFTESEINRISSLPNEYFKKNDFNTGILKVGQAIDEGITTKAIKTNQVEVVNNGLNKTVQPKKSYTGLIVFLVIMAAAIIFFIYWLKKRANKKAEDFARRNGLDYDSNDSGTYRSSDVSGGTSTFKNTNPSTHQDSFNERTVNNTTIINNQGYNSGYSNNGFVEGMIVGEMLENNHNREDNYHHEERHENNNHSNDSSNLDNDNENKTSSGDWGLSSGSSDWGSSDSGSSDWGSSSSDSGSSSGSDW